MIDCYVAKTVKKVTSVIYILYSMFFSDYSTICLVHIYMQLSCLLLNW